MFRHSIFTHADENIHARAHLWGIRRAVTMAASAAFAVLVCAVAVADSTSSMTGFTAAGAAAQKSLEQQFDRRLDPKDLRGWLESMSSEPNHVGSPHDRQNADFMLQQFRQWGWEAHIETFQVLYPTPLQERLEMTAPVKFVASLHEPAVGGDRTSSISGVLPPYAVYGADGDVTGELVYVNYGMPDDYRELARRGISVKGRIVIARYGGGWRGTKPRVAHEHGAIGCIIYSDPHDEGYFRGDVYPRGGWRPDASVQRGSVLDASIYPGDPLTPGVGASETAKRLTIAEAATLAKIPVLPISAADAAPLLAALNGPVVPAEWRGALPMTYHIGAGPATVHLLVRSEWTLKPIYDVIATIKGSEFPEEWVIRGNHHDGWVFGAADPLAGNAALMAEAKSIGALLQTGWRPRRTLIYAGWDAEEPGWIGSTEWAELHGADLQRHAVLYVNSDVNARGFLVSGGSHSLQHFVNEVAGGIRDPQTGVSVRDRLRAKLSVDRFSSAADSEPASPSGDLPLAALGSGTDFTAFLQHLGIATLDLYYSGEDNGEGSWHSIYDSFDGYIRFGDPQFAYGIAEAETVGHVVLRFADADVLPLRISDFAATLQGYDNELHALAKQAKSHAETLARLLASHSFALAADPMQKLDAPVAESPVPAIHFEAFDRSVARLNHAAAAYDQAYAQFAANGRSLAPATQVRLNALLRGLEQSLTFPGGLPGRPWFKHLIYAPGLDTGYAPKTVPGIREAIEQGRWDEAARYIVITANALEAYCDQVDAARALIGGRPAN
jgi:N-acetylated-alpha-linked acidic dipeptidase